ncbi:MAG: hypothetical protein ACK5MQ_09955, partial [Pikeienuella sp.]
RAWLAAIEAAPESAIARMAQTRLQEMDAPAGASPAPDEETPPAATSDSDSEPARQPAAAPVRPQRVEP